MLNNSGACIVQMPQHQMSLLTIDLPIVVSWLHCGITLWNSYICLTYCVMQHSTRVFFRPNAVLDLYDDLICTLHTYFCYICFTVKTICLLCSEDPCPCRQNEPQACNIDNGHIMTPCRVPEARNLYAATCSLELLIPLFVG